jgi:hypothetical protein
VTPASTRIAVGALVAALVLQPGCATLFAGGPDDVSVMTNPPGAYVYVNAVFIGQTPTVARLDRDHPGQIQIYLPGFRPVVMVRMKSINGWFIANLLWLAAIVPIVVDLVTGNWQRYDDSPIAIGLVPAQDAQAPPWYQPPAQPYLPGQPAQPPPAQPQPQPQPGPQPPGPPLPPPVAPPPVAPPPVR